MERKFTNDFERKKKLIKGQFCSLGSRPRLPCTGSVLFPCLVPSWMYFFPISREHFVCLFLTGD